MISINWLIAILTTSARSLLRSPRRTVFSLLSIAAATAAILVFQSFVVAVTAATRKNVITAHYGHFEIMKKDYRQGKVEDPYAYQINRYDEIRDAINSDVSELAFISRRLEFYALLNFKNRSIGAVGLGIDAKEEQKFMTLAQVQKGVHLADATADSAFVGEGLAEALHLTVGDTVTALVTTNKGSINAKDLPVGGIFKTGVPDLDDRTFYVNHPIAETLLRVKGAPRILIAFKDDDELSHRAALNAMLAAKFPDLKAVHWQERAPFYDNLMGWLNRQIFVFYAIVLLIATISIVNVFTMGLLERTGEFGTLRAIGTDRSDLSIMIFAESMFQALFGSLIGVVLGALIIVGPLHGGITMPPPPMMSIPFHVSFAIPWGEVLGTVVLCTCVAGLSGIFPAIRMARLNIVAALGRNV